MKQFCCRIFLLGYLAVASAHGAWTEDFARMPLPSGTTVLDRHNCVKVMLESFRRNPAIKALIFMPGATDEFYFFRRAHAALTNSAPTLLDAVAALTNQTYIRATVQGDFLLLHTDEDSLEPIFTVNDQRTAVRLYRKHFEKHAVFNDRDWDYLRQYLTFDLDTRVLPGPMSHESYHFFRHSFAEYDLNGWETLSAVALAGKTTVEVDKKVVIFSGDTRVKATTNTPSADFLYGK